VLLVRTREPRLTHNVFALRGNLTRKQSIISRPVVVSTMAKKRDVRREWPKNEMPMKASRIALFAIVLSSAFLVGNMSRLEPVLLVADILALLIAVTLGVSLGAMLRRRGSTNVWQAMNGSFWRDPAGHHDQDLPVRARS